MDGPYSVVRNPLYCFSFLGAIGFGLAVENPLLALALAAAFCGYYWLVVSREEAFLRGRFGDAFNEYAARVPRWFPKPWLYRESRSVTVDPKIMRRGIVDATCFIWVYALWELLEVIRGTWL